jgi:starch synthase
MAHRILAGSDFFLMPSLYEPCGLTAMYALRYGAIPIVRAVGGLPDIVRDCCMDSGTGTGVLFRATEVSELTACIRRAVQLRRDPVAFHGLIQRSMSERFEWAAAAAEYVEMYKRAMLRRAELAHL